MCKELDHELEDFNYYDFVEDMDDVDVDDILKDAPPLVDIDE